VAEFDPLVGPPAQELGSTPPPPPPGLDDDQGDDVEEIPPDVDVGTVRSILAGLGNVGSMVDRAAPNLWRFTDSELDQLAPPICRLANRNETLRRALLHGDFVVIAMGLSTYAVRNVTARKEATNGQRNQAQSGHRPDGGQAPFGISDGSPPAANHVRGVPAYGPPVDR
jgi:hypothetical protein